MGPEVGATRREEAVEKPDGVTTPGLKEEDPSIERSQTYEDVEALYRAAFVGTSNPSKNSSEFNRNVVRETDFVVDKTLASGAFAVVQKAYMKTDTDEKGMPVAVKVLKTRDQMSLKQFLLESDLLQSLNHRHIVRVRGIGMLQNGPIKLPYLLEDLADGGSLRDAILSHTHNVRTREYSAVEAVRWLAQLASAFVYLHERNVMHRDLKTDNVLLHNAPDGDLEVRLADFGLFAEIDAKQQIALRTHDRPAFVPIEENKTAIPRSVQSNLSSVRVQSNLSSVQPSLPKTDRLYKCLTVTSSSNLDIESLLTKESSVLWEPNSSEVKAILENLEVVLDANNFKAKDGLRLKPRGSAPTEPSCPSYTSGAHTSSGLHTKEVHVYDSMEAALKSRPDAKGRVEVDAHGVPHAVLPGRNVLLEPSKEAANTPIVGKSEAQHATESAMHTRANGTASRLREVRSDLGDHVRREGSPAPPASAHKQAGPKLRQSLSDNSRKGALSRFASNAGGEPTRRTTVNGTDPSPGYAYMSTPKKACGGVAPQSGFTPPMTKYGTSIVLLPNTPDAVTPRGASRPVEPRLSTKSSLRTTISNLTASRRGPQRQGSVAFMLTGCTGSMLYMAPEVARAEPYNQKADVYSFGIVMYELLSWFPLQLIASPQQSSAELDAYVRRAIGPEAERPPHLDATPQRIRDLIDRCWHAVRTERPPMKEVLKQLEAMLSDGEVDEFERVLAQHRPLTRKAKTRIYLAAHPELRQSSGRSAAFAGGCGCSCVIQ